jgi:serine/threonine-protein kinase HipA
MSSEPDRAFVWVWLPGALEPVVAGRLDVVNRVVSFTYGRSYLENLDAIPLYLPELPLRRGPIAPLVGDIAGCIADAGPDSWGQRVILNRRAGADALDTTQLGRLTYLLESGSDRIGALDFQASPSEYIARSAGHAPLQELAESAERVEQGIPLSPALDAALLRGSSIGGARPKALLDAGERRLIAKFSSTTDTYPMVKGEYMAMELAARAGLDAAKVELTSALGRDVLLVERFDRTATGARRAMVSVLTILALDEIAGRYATYYALADTIRSRFTAPDATLRELFSRITFNILTGNTDDHPRNHAAFWDGTSLTLTPAYDIAPHPRAGGEAAQIMAIGRDGWRMSQVAGCIRYAHEYHLSERAAREVIDHQIDVIENGFDDVCKQAGLTEVERRYFWRRQFLNPYALEGYSRRQRPAPAAR